MKIQFLGTAAAEGVPALFCNCEVCMEMRRRGEWHTRSQYVIDGVLGIEFPPDAYYHSLRFGLDLAAMRHLLITHSHQDHCYAHDFILRGYKYADKEVMPLTVYGNAEVLKVFRECTAREMKETVAKNYTLVEVKPFEPFFCEEYRVTALLAQHSQTETAFVYLIEKGDISYLHLTDTGRLPKESLEYLQAYFENRENKLNFVTFDCNFLFRTAGETSRHMGLEDNKAMEGEFLRRGIANGHTTYAITHFSHNGAPLSERLQKAQKEYGYIPAYDGLCIEL